ncbi:MAG: hypothetical protein ACFFCD_06575 [Promethearchaeota archaeon]
MRSRKWTFFTIFFISTLTLTILTYSTLVYPEESQGWTHSLSVKTINDEDATRFKVIGTAIDVQVIPFEKQVVKGELLEVNVTVFDKGNAIGNAKIKLILKQRSTEHETTDFTKLQPGVYKTSFNTTVLTIGQWSLTAEVHAGGDTYYGTASVAITESPEPETSENPVFLIISVAGICIGTVGLVLWTSIELMGKRKKRKKRKKK